MVLSIAQSVFDGIRWVVDFFINKTPRVIQILIFLLLLLIFGNLLSWALHLGGVHCNSDKDAVKVDTIDITSNVKIFWWVASGNLDDPTVSIQEAHPWTKYVYLQNTLDSCVFILEYTNGRYVACENLSGNCTFYYKNAECHNCTVLDVGWVYAPDRILNWLYAGEVCGGDATRLDDQNWAQRNLLCEPLCEVPENYAWNVSAGNFYCTEPGLCGANATQPLKPRVDLELKSAGAELMYPNKDSKSIDNFIRIKCSDNFNPRMTIYGIDLFDYRIWIVLIVVYVMFIFLSYVKKH